MTRLALLLTALTLGCHSAPAPITDPAPFGNPDQEVAYVIEVPGRGEVEGLMVETREGDREQVRTSLNVNGEVAFLSARLAEYDDRGLASFRYVSRGGSDGEQVIDGKVSDGTLQVTENGEALPPLDWSQAHRLGGPGPSDVVSTGFKPGATITAPCFLMTHDTKAIHLVRYTVKGPTTYRGPSGRSQPAHVLRIQSPMKLLNGTDWIVDERGRLLETSIPLRGLGSAVRIRLLSRIERPPEEAPQRLETDR